jgi:hypothetical protein
MENRMPVAFSDLLLAFEFASFGAPYEHEAFLCKQSGQIYWHSDFDGEFDELPEDIEEPGKYVRIPHKNELDLARALVFAFAKQRLPRELDEVERIFSRRGAYARFKDLLDRKGALEVA